jgi:hypothetical protein
MTLWGWVFLGVSWGVLTAVTVWCFVKIFKAPFTSDEPPAQAVRNTRPKADRAVD